MMRKIILSLVLLIFSSHLIGKVVVIDPGHNYDDITTGYKSEMEVYANWNVANLLKEKIESNFLLDWEVVFTRNNNDPGEENYVGLDERERIANNMEAGAPGEVYFLSIHCNAGGGFGTETFYCNRTYTTNYTLLKKYAENVQSYVVDLASMNNRRCVEDFEYFVNDAGVHYHLGVLKDLTMPNCLNEMGFVDNLTDSYKLTFNSYGQHMFAYAYLEALNATFSDVNVVKFEILNLPCYANSENFCKINVTIKNISYNTFNGEVRAMLRLFPTFQGQSATTDFCQLGSNENLFIMPGQERTISFGSNIPLTMDLGLALCVETRSSFINDWEAVPVPSNKQILKIPINGAKIQGVIYGNDYNPFNGAEIWSYKNPDKSSPLDFSSQKVISDFFDPTKTFSNSQGRYDILVPYEWEEAVLSVKNLSNYDEKLVSPISNGLNFVHNYTSSPVVIGVGSGSGSGSCAGVRGQDPKDPLLMWGGLSRFEKIRINGQENLAIVDISKPFRFEVFPKPVLASCIQNYGCGGGVTPLLIYESFIDCCFDEYFISIIKCDHNLNPVGEEISRWFNTGLGQDVLIGDIDLNNTIKNMGINLNGFYRIKIADKSGYSGWTEKVIYISALPTNQKLSGTLYGNYYSKGNMELSQITKTMKTTVIASNQILIKPNSHISGNFNALINPEFEQSSSQGSPGVSSSELEENMISSSNMLSLDGVRNFKVSKLPTQCACKDSLSVAEENIIKVFPNPAREFINVETNFISEGFLQIIDIRGQVIIDKVEFRAPRVIVNTGVLDKGVYIVKIINHKSSIVAKFIKN